MDSKISLKARAGRADALRKHFCRQLLHKRAIILRSDLPVTAQLSMPEPQRPNA